MRQAQTGSAPPPVGRWVANHVGLGALVGLGMAHAGPAVLALPWIGMKVVAGATRSVWGAA